MSSTATRRFKRKKEKDKKNGVYVQERELNLPTPEEVQEYISNKSKELRMTDPFDNMDDFFVEVLSTKGVWYRSHLIDFDKDGILVKFDTNR